MIREKLQLKLDYYVYVLYFPGTKIPMYVGKGTKDRWSQHAMNIRCFHQDIKSNPRLYNTLARLFVKGIEVPREKVLEYVTERQAHECEKKLIAEYGLLGQNGLLLNKLRGGRGFNSGFIGPHSDETRKRMSESHKGKRQSEEMKEKVRNKLLGLKRTLTDEQRATRHLRFNGARGPGMLGKKHSQETIEKMRNTWRLTRVSQG